MTKKHFQIHGLDKALEDVPEDQREELVAEIVAELGNFDSAESPGEPVRVVAPGSRTCPSCGGGLVELGVIPNPLGEVVCILECEICDATLCEAATAPLQ